MHVHVHVHVMMYVYCCMWHVYIPGCLLGTHISLWAFQVPGWILRLFSQQVSMAILYNSNEGFKLLPFIFLLIQTQSHPVEGVLGKHWLCFSWRSAWSCTYMYLIIKPKTLSPENHLWKKKSQDLKQCVCRWESNPRPSQLHCDCSTNWATWTKFLWARLWGIRYLYMYMYNNIGALWCRYGTCTCTSRLSWKAPQGWHAESDTYGFQLM